MSNIEIDRDILDAIAIEDFDAGLNLALTRYAAAIKNGDKERRLILLRLVRGIAGKILQRELIDNYQEPDNVPLCDYCSRELDSSKIVQGHSGKICNECVNRIHENLQV